MAKSPSRPYAPANVPNNPEALPTFLFDELWRIATAININPEGVSLQETRSVPITTAPTETFLFVGQDPIFDIPGGGWDKATGEWTAQVTGGYQFNFQTWMQKFTVPGNRTYSFTLNIYVNGILTYQVADSANDQYDATATAALADIVQAGDKLTFSITTQASVVLPNANVQAALSVYRIYAT